MDDGRRRLPTGLRARAAARHRAAVIRFCQPLRCEFGLTLRELCERLHEARLRTFEGRRWRVHYLSRVLPRTWTERARWARKRGHVGLSKGEGNAR